MDLKMSEFLTYRHHSGDINSLARKSSPATGPSTYYLCDQTGGRSLIQNPASLHPEQRAEQETQMQQERQTC